jgi:hypothetical protein
MTTSADLPSQNVVVGLTGASFAEDFSFVDVRFAMEQNAGLTLRMTPSNLSQVTSKLNEFLSFIQSRTLTKGDHFAVHASEAVDVTAGAAAGGGKVILSIKGTNNVVSNFALPVAIVARFRPELRQAVQSAERQSKQTRQ